MRRFALTLTFVASAMCVPAIAHAQASIAGVVKDASGAVLPGVTVEAASPALIEKVRTVVTDGTGQYRIVDLRPGPYTVTFTLTGFNSVKREGIELTGSFVATVDIEMRVGALEETIVVTGEAPMVDVQSATRQQVQDRAIIDSIPAGRSPYALGVLAPAVSLNSGNTDVGGSDLNATQGLAAHGGKFGDQVVMQSGLPVTAQASSGWVSRVNINMAAVQEVAVDFAAVSAEHSSGGVRVDILPRDGGNAFEGTLFASYSNESLQGNNFTQALRDLGLSTPDANRAQLDVNPGFGGPLKRDKVWFYVAGRYAITENYKAGIFNNLNANNPAAWVYAPDTSSRPFNGQVVRDGSVRLAWQATPRNKIGVVYQHQANCACPQDISATRSPEANRDAEFPLQRKIVADWSAPVTSRLLLQGGMVHQFGESNRVPTPGLNPLMIAVQEQSIGLNYRGPDPGLRLQDNLSVHYRLSAAYVTGAHSAKVGMSANHGHFHQQDYDVQPVSYRFNNGVPNRISTRALPREYQNDVKMNFGLFAQDSWSLERLTAGYGIRFDYFNGGYDEQRLGPTEMLPNRNLVFPGATTSVWKDVTPHFGATYDLFGSGRTALKVSYNKYLENVTAASALSARNPLLSIVSSNNRSWNDANRNFVPDCDLRNPAAQDNRATGGDQCGAWDNPNLGNPISAAAYDPAIVSGWGIRGYNWEFSAGVQHEIVPRVSLDVGYFRRWFGNHKVTDNRTLSAADFDAFSITSPSDPRLPAGGRAVIGNLYNLKPASFGQRADNFVTLAGNYGDQIERWHGVDLSINARPRFGLIFQGGLSTGKTTTDTCEIRAALPEIDPTNPHCHVETAYLTQIKGLASYTIPRIDVQVSATLQNLPGPVILADFTATNAVVLPSLGRPLAGGAANVTVPIVEPGTLYGDRLNQVDLRISKLLAFAGTRSRVSLDLYNAMNSDAVLEVNNNFAAWQRPTEIMPARFAKFSVQFDF